MREGRKARFKKTVIKISADPRRTRRGPCLWLSTSLSSLTPTRRQSERGAREIDEGGNKKMPQSPSDALVESLLGAADCRRDVASALARVRAWFGRSRCSAAAAVFVGAATDSISFPSGWRETTSFCFHISLPPTRPSPSSTATRGREL